MLKRLKQNIQLERIIIMKLNIKENYYGLNINDLIAIGNRAYNEKRNFLFISKCIGKHLPINPDMIRMAGLALAHEMADVCFLGNSPLNGRENEIRNFISNPPAFDDENHFKHPYLYQEDLSRGNRDVLVIGFAETATGLGMGVAASIKNAYYVTTSREKITSIESCLDFEETHSHATSHQCFLDDANKLKSDTIILVDDEITTGNTMLNLIENLEKFHPCKDRVYIVGTILDWRSDEQRQKFEEYSKKLNVIIKVVSLVSGTIENDDTRVFEDNVDNELSKHKEVVDLTSKTSSLFTRRYVFTDKGFASYWMHSGRFGLDNDEILNIDVYAQYAANLIEKELLRQSSTNPIANPIPKFDNGINGRMLVVGHGENIYIPSRIASCLGADFKTTTRSPIYISNENNYPIKERHSFMDGDVKYYFYDKSFIEGYYDKVIFIVENDLAIKLCDNVSIFKI